MLRITNEAGNDIPNSDYGVTKISTKEVVEIAVPLKLLTKF